MRSIILVIHNIRSALNVGSMFRTADGLGVHKVFVTGYTPYPLSDSDTRLPHIGLKIDKQIHKSALGAEKSVDWEHFDDVFDVITKLRNDGYKVIALEQHKDTVMLLDYDPPEKIAVIVGREVEGIEPVVLKCVDNIVEIPMLGQKESLNVAVAAAIVLYHCRYFQ